ncbi:MAG: CPBP family intramembrane metalloprotease [Flavobacteriales bacterium]|nr:CPBP family intramembrane metalloprotease [Flavobacteriales bacterium]
MGGIGALLVRITQDRDVGTVVFGTTAWHTQLLLGVLLGVLPALGAWRLLRWHYVLPVTERYARVLHPWLGHRLDRWVISFCAGVGEELLFRGALQYWLGVPLTAIGFVALHGYLDPRNARVTMYGAYLVLCMLAYGTVAEHIGLLPAMIAHFLFDVILLQRLHALGARLLKER